MTTLLERIGGQDAVTAAVDLFYTKVLEDPQLAPFFADSNMDHQRRRQVAFLTQVLAGKGKMAETYMRNVHRPLVENMGLNETHFGMVAGHLAATLEELEQIQFSPDHIRRRRSSFRIRLR